MACKAVFLQILEHAQHNARNIFEFFLNSAVSGKILLRINMDETSLCLFQGHDKGNVFIHKSAKTRRHISRVETRTHLSHVAFICDDLELQAILPQIIIANKRTITEAELG